MPDTPQNILRFWRNLEIFNLPNPHSEANPLFDMEQLPWEMNEPTEYPNAVWRYTLYFGRVAKSSITDYLETITGEPKREDWMEPVTGETFLAGLVLYDDGKPNWNSYVQASYIHGIHSLAKDKPLTKINELLAEVQVEFEKRYNIEAQSTGADTDGNTIRKGDVVTREFLVKEMQLLKEIIGPAFTFEEEIYWTRKEVAADSEIDATILNSFYLDDLNYLMDHPKAYGKALKEYLLPEVNMQKRVDVIADKAALVSCLNPTLLSPGRWPSPVSNRLYTAQQGAVNTLMADLRKSGGMRGINGPPGTGKTTLLLDIIADIIVSRAEILMQTNLKAIFDKRGNTLSKEGSTYKYYYYHTAKDELFDGYGIVVSSNNNSAVENISKELPAMDKIDAELLREDEGYFIDCASRLLKGKKSWGVLSAPLGNSTNRYLFKRNFWDTEGLFPGFNGFLNNVYKDKENDQTDKYAELFKETSEELKKLLKEFRSYQKDISSFHTKATPSRKELEKNYDLKAWDVVDDEFLQKQHERIHLSKPYSSPQINELRSRILIKSLKLHEFAILANAKQFRNNLQLFMEMINGKMKIPENVSPALWNTFFFCIPVVSTTLASVSRLFRHLGKESIGWLLLDEAGQATPASAAGIIGRSKRCIIVGDPLQIKPVVTHPEQLIKILAEGAGISDPVWSPKVSSVQSLADRVSDKGTYLGEGNWAGFPLRTHRRCDNPMFAIANKIAYEGKMVKATKEDKPFECVLGPSCWFDVDGILTVGKHVIKEEIDLLKEKIDELIYNGYRKEIFVITPFTSVKSYCNDVFESQKKIVKCGTIHTFQGREAEIVFLVLGSDPTKDKARRWVTESPNMINVALTRAKRRFFMIGNKKHWGHLPFIRQFEGLLPVVENINP